MLGVLEVLIESDLKTEISSGMADIPIHQQGAIMMFYLVTNFDINNFDGQNVSKAIINMKALAHALRDDLPTNVVRCILMGPGKGSNEVLKNLYSTSLALLSNSM